MSVVDIDDAETDDDDDDDDEIDDVEVDENGASWAASHSSFGR